MCENEIEENYSANATFNGIHFQTIAAISILIDNINDFVSIKNEGIEDVVIELPNKKYIFVQSKSSLEEFSKKAIPNLCKSFKTLAVANSKYDAISLLFVTNYKNIFGSETDYSDFRSGQTRKFQYFSSINKCVVEKNAPASFPLDKYAVQYLQYAGDDIEKECDIRSKLKDCLSERVSTKRLHAGKVFDTWKKYLDYNATSKDPTRVYSRERMVWGMILHKLSTIEQDIYEDTDEDYSEVSAQYDYLLNSYSGRFEVISRIHGAFNLYRMEAFPRSASYREYANEHWSDYEDLLETYSMGKTVKKKLLILLISTIITKMSVIIDVKKEMGV